ncbi:hypothetical protein BDV12DRAFT_197855 [Aspergillus spectabilis]
MDSGTIESVKLDATIGLAPAGEWTLAINIPQLVKLLALPRQLRAHNCFSSQTICMVDRELTMAHNYQSKSTESFRDSSDISWTTVAWASYGLAIRWKPPHESAWLAGFLKNVITCAVGFIPVIGPVAAVSFPLTWTAIVEPEKLVCTLRELVPMTDLVLKISEEISENSKSQKRYLPREWEKDPYAEL